MPDFTFCPQCHTKYRTAGMPAFKRLRCKKCQGIFVVPVEAPLAPGGRGAGGEGDVAGGTPTVQDAEHAIPAAIGDQSTLGRANFRGGVTLDGSPLPPVDDGSASQDTMEGMPGFVEKKIEAAIKPAATDEKYVVEGEIARGGMGVILKAADRDIRRPVAMKVMLDAKSPKDKARFVEEAQVTGQLEHPNIVPIHELGIDAENRLFFTMKLVKGKSLKDVLDELRDAELPPAKRKKRAIAPLSTQDSSLSTFPLGRLLNAFISICNAIAFAHAKGVVHRDLKPANIMLGDYGEVLVMDWGLAKPGAALPNPLSPARERGRGEGAAEGEPADAGTDSRDRELAEAVKSLRQETGGELTLDGTILGTPHYMPPEQADGMIGDIDARSDIYSLGAMLYEILTLNTPCEGKGIHALILNVSQGNITPPDQRTPKRNIPKELSAITMKALARRKEDRYQRVEDLRRDIELFIEGRAVSAKADTFAESVVKLVKRNKTASVVAVAAFVLLSLGGAVAAWVNFEARTVAETERAKSDQALTDYRREKEAKERAEAARREQARQSIPAFMRSARWAMNERQFEDALAPLDVVVGYDPENPEALLLRSQVLLVLQRYADARRDLEQYTSQRPGDAAAQEVLNACRNAQTGDSVMPMVLADLFTRQQAFALADGMLRSTETNAVVAKEKLLALYRQRVEKTWPGLGQRLSKDEQGSFHLNLRGCQQVADLAPLRGMPLTSLNLESCGKVSDLGPLTGMLLSSLNLHGCSQVRDLTPLKSMPLTSLNLTYCAQVKDLSALKGMQLPSLGLGYCAQVSDLGPLKGMPLVSLDLAQCVQVDDLTPLAGMQLTSLNLGGCVRVRDLAPLKDMPLSSLELWGCSRVNDLTPLAGMPLRSLNLKSVTMQKLTPLKGMPLNTLSLWECRTVSDLSPLRGLPLTSLNLCGCVLVDDLSPLEGMRLTWLHIAGSHVHDLKPLEGMPLSRLEASRTPLSDLAPLIGMPLTQLLVDNCRHLRDLSPLKAMNLQEVTMTPKNIETGMEILREMKSLQTIGTSGERKLAAAEFWRRYDAGEFNK
jgi:serine/threonine protein kinase